MEVLFILRKIFMLKKGVDMKYLIKKPETFISSINDEIYNILHKNFNTIFPEYLFQKETEAFAMPVDIKEFDTEYRVKIEIPGVSSDNLEINATKNCIKLHAEKTEEKEDRNSKYNKTEFKYGQFERNIYFPSEIDVENTKVKLHNGVLKINAPKIKSDEEKTSKLTVEE